MRRIRQGDIRKTPPPAKAPRQMAFAIAGGGEKICPPGRVNHRVADLLRESGVPPWHRGRLPFVFMSDGDGFVFWLDDAIPASGSLRRWRLLPVVAPDECGWQLHF